ncbi:MAG: DUF3784 domain-containing protein [Defluviitaleaceae bacterium]|nr:DUF3784 domain-containing protein [Defluviitaleaceae bacterium]
MDLLTYLIFGGIILLMLAMSVVLLTGRGAFLISGYNTMGRSQKALYDEKALCRFTGRLLLVISLLLCFIPLGIALEAMWMLACAVALILAVTVAAVIYFNSSTKFFAVQTAAGGVEVFTVKKKINRRIFVILVSVALVFSVGISLLLHYGAKEPVISVTAEGIHIKTLYGLTVEFKEISSITLLYESMAELGVTAGDRVSGYGGIGGTLKGNYKNKTLGEMLLFVSKDSSPTIRIARAGGKDIYISFEDPAKTLEAYGLMR